MNLKLHVILHFVVRAAAPAVMAPLALLSILAPAQAQTAPAVSPSLKLPVEARLGDGAMLQVKSAWWHAPSEMRAGTATTRNANFPDTERWLAVALELRLPGGKVPSTEEWRGLRGRIVGAAEDGTLRVPSEAGENFSMLFRKVDPHSGPLAIEFEWLPPGRQTPGTFEETLEVKELPIPRTVDEPIKIEREITSSQGTRIVVESVTFANTRSTPKRQQIEVRLRWYPPEKHRDMCAIFRAVHDGAIDDQGTVLSAFTPGMAGVSERVRSGFRQVLPLIHPPAADARTFSMKISLRQHIDSVRAAAASRFKIQLNPQSLFLQGPTSPLPAARAITEQAEATIESWQAIQGANFEPRLRLWFEDLQRPQNEEYRWVPHILKFTRQPDAVSAEPESRQMSMYTPQLIYWKVNGSPRAPGESGIVKEHSFKAFKHPSTLVDVEATWREWKYKRVTLDWPDLPCPAPGQVIEVKKEVDIAFGSSLVLRKVGHFTEAQTLTPALAASLDGLAPPGGLILLFEIIRGADDRKQSDEDIFYKSMSVQDDKGTDLLRYCGRDQLRGQLLHEATPGDYLKWHSVFLQAPAPGATRFHLQATINRVRMSDRTQTLTFRGLPVAAPAAAQ